ncbi:MAG: DHH family phosphoesterase [Firmicutes bacterium]|nr:DHH family phosphoesterase [Bacillota bacterium]
MYAGRIERLLAYYTPAPMCIVNSQGKVSRASQKIADVFKYDNIVDYDIFALTGIKMAEIIEAAKEDKVLYIERNDRIFKIFCSFLGEEENASIMMYFQDVTSYDKLKTMYNEEKVCLALVNIDNYDELAANEGEDREMAILTELDILIRRWASELDAAVIRYRDPLYEIVLRYKDVKQLAEGKFEILDRARSVKTDADFPVTLSIGVGIGGKTMAETDDYAQDALDLAMGRGGDQAVVKNIRNLEFYGGKSQSVEKSNKGKSRIIAHALKALMAQSSKVFIMGHKNPDMDCFGAALGVYRIALSAGKEPYIVFGEYNETMTDIVTDAKKDGTYQFISAESAIGMADERSVVVVVDVHRPSIVESVELIEKVDQLAVIDHHRKAKDVLPNQTISYMESYASSASELVTEMLQYVTDRKSIRKLEADALLAGIMLDTNRFAVKAGVRTFEAASWLKRVGADLQTVRRYFQSNATNFRARALGVASARILDGGIAMSICEGKNINSQIINSQVADELLTIKGVEASFVAGQDENGMTVVSARSLGNLNVQSVMEAFGGGGHLNTAGAKTDVPPEQILKDIEDFLKTSH